jgi:hypothetical protein
MGSLFSSCFENKGGNANSNVLPPIRDGDDNANENRNNDGR